MTAEGTTAHPKKERFLEALAETASVSIAAKLSGVPRRTAYNWRKRDEAFAAEWLAAVELGCNALEDEAIRRGAQGMEKPIYQGGKLVGSVREYSDALLMFMLKALRPHKFKDRMVKEVTGPEGGGVQVELADTRQRNIDLINRIAGRLA